MSASENKAQAEAAYNAFAAGDAKSTAGRVTKVTPPVLARGAGARANSARDSI